jgi:hypothetical protein
VRLTLALRIRWASSGRGHGCANCFLAVLEHCGCSARVFGALVQHFRSGSPRGSSCCMERRPRECTHCFPSLMPASPAEAAKRPQRALLCYSVTRDTCPAVTQRLAITIAAGAHRRRFSCAGAAASVVKGRVDLQPRSERYPMYARCAAS